MFPDLKGLRGNGGWQDPMEGTWGLFLIAILSPILVAGEHATLLTETPWCVSLKKYMYANVLLHTSQRHTDVRQHVRIRI